MDVIQFILQLEIVGDGGHHGQVSARLPVRQYWDPGEGVRGTPEVLTEGESLQTPMWNWI